METIRTQYSAELYKRMCDAFPELRNKTLQNILDQRRQLFKNNRIPQPVIAKVREEVQKELGMITTTNADEDKQTPADVETQSPDDKYTATLCRNLMLYKGTDPTKRPKLMRLRMKLDTNATMGYVNERMAHHVSQCKNIEELQTVVYAAATSVLELNSQTRRPQTQQPATKKKSWERRLTNKINTLREQIGRVTGAVRDTIKNERTKREVRTIIEKYKSAENPNMTDVLDLLKQRLAVLSNRLRRYRVSRLRRQQNQQFAVNQKQFYRDLESQEVTSRENNVYDIDAMRTFWDTIWSVPETHNRKAGWIEEEERRMRNTTIMRPVHVTKEDLQAAISKTANWKAPGVDGIHNFWYKKLDKAHDKMAELFNEVVTSPTKMPRFMTCGITYLLPKTTPPTPDPAMYRPITCLPTIYKILTAIIATKITEHLTDNDVMAEEQKGSRQRSRGCKEQLLIDAIVTGNAKKARADLCTAYIDYRKAFDSIPHTWLLHALEIYKIDPVIVNVLETIMNAWNTTLILNGNLKSSPIKIRRGIFQGDALSPLWFCLALNPLSFQLNKNQYGYQLKNRDHNISHLFYMDDLKLYSNNNTNMQKLLRRTETFSKDIRMEFGLDKCGIHSMHRGKWKKEPDYTLTRTNKNGTPQVIKNMEEDEAYKYLGMEQNRGINKSKVKDKLKTETKRRIVKVLKTKLSARNICTAVNTYAIPVLVYSFGVIHWTPTELDQLNRDIRVLFTKHRAHHPRASIERFHLPRQHGGRGVIDVKNMYYRQVSNLRGYFIGKATTSKLHKAMTLADTSITPLNLASADYDPALQITSNDMKIDQWKAKELHGRFAHRLEDEHIDRTASLQWLTYGNIFPETEGFAIAIQDQVIPTRSYKKYILKDQSVPSTLCRICQNQNETIEHLLCSCTPLANTDYMRRHNNVAKILHQAIARLYDDDADFTPYYNYTPPNVIDTDEIKLYWDRTVLTDRTVAHNRPDITLTLKKKKTTYLVDVAVPAPANVKMKYNEKIQKYLPLSQDIRNTWQQEVVSVIPVIVGATGEIPKSLHEALKQLGLPQQLYKQLQKTVILEACHIMRKTLNEA